MTDLYTTVTKDELARMHKEAAHERQLAMDHANDCDCVWCRWNTNPDFYSRVFSYITVEEDRDINELYAEAF